jgi:glyoxylase-like metal-dependent hydrolase (beta-lactamase superfamily II)
MRKLLIVIAGLLALCVCALLLFIAPAHWQIRHIEPALPEWGALDAALNTSGGPVKISVINTATQPTSFGLLGHPAVLIEWADGRRFMIDTGMPPELAVAFGEPMELLGAGPTATHGAVAIQLGESVESVRGIAFTHLHSDHTDGLPGVCEAQKHPATVYQTALQREELNYSTKLGLVALDAAVCPREVLPQGVIKPVPGFPGLVAISLGGHTPGSTLYAARVGDKTWLFSGDITNDRRSLLEDLPKPWWYSALIVPENTERNAQLRAWFRSLDDRTAVTVLPAHDIAAMEASGLIN